MSCVSRTHTCMSHLTHTCMSHMSHEALASSHIQTPVCHTSPVCHIPVCHIYPYATHVTRDVPSLTYSSLFPPVSHTHTCMSHLTHTYTSHIPIRHTCHMPPLTYSSIFSPVCILTSSSFLGKLHIHIPGCHTRREEAGEMYVS